MNRYINFFLALTLCCSAVACSAGSQPTSETNEEFSIDTPAVVEEPAETEEDNMQVEEDNTQAAAVPAENNHTLQKAYPILAEQENPLKAAIEDEKTVTEVQPGVPVQATTPDWGTISKDWHDYQDILDNIKP